MRVGGQRCCMQSYEEKCFQNDTAFSICSDTLDIVYALLKGTALKLSLEFPKSRRSLTHLPSFFCYSSSFCLFSLRFFLLIRLCSLYITDQDGETIVLLITYGVFRLYRSWTLPVTLVLVFTTEALYDSRCHFFVSRETKWWFGSSRGFP